MPGSVENYINQYYLMISKSHRFHGHSSLSYVYKHGRVVRGPLMALKFVPNDRRTEYRLSVVVSKKVAKLAVVRNRIRRRLYEVVRHYEPQITVPHDVVITVFSDVVQALPADELERTVRAQLLQAGLIQRSS